MSPKVFYEPRKAFTESISLPEEMDPIKKLLSALLPPSIRETRQAWENVISEPQEGDVRLPFAPKVNINALGKGMYGTLNALSTQPGMEFIQPLQIRAFHGSPYRFSKFENKAIGMGEGAQAFGYGHYVTESEEVARKYARNLERIKKADEMVSKHYTGKWNPESIKATVYETTIHKGKQPSEYTYLEWDKPVPIDTLTKIGFQRPVVMNGNELYRQLISIIAQGTKNDAVFNKISKVLGVSEKKLAFGNTEKYVSQYLNSIGYSGIKYPTGSLSGIKGSKEYNYVVFNPEDIVIEGVK